MFEAKLQEGHVFKKIIESLKDLVKSVNFDANNTGLSMQAMDSSHVALVSFFLHESGFSSFRCDRPQTLGLSIENLSKILKCASNDDSISLSAEEDPSTIRFVFESNKGDRFSEFNLNLLQIDSEQLGIPETEYSSVITMSSSEFTKICRELANLSETLQIETSKESVKFSINGEHGKGCITIKSNDSDKKEEQCILEIDEPVNLSFALRYLNLFNKAAPLSHTVVLYLSNDTPLVVEYQIERLGSLKFYLAPKINDETEGQ